MIAGQDPQSAGVDRQHLGYAELHREVADAGGQRLVVGGLQLLVPERLGQILVEFGGQPIEPLEEFGVLGELVEALRGDGTENGDRVASGQRPVPRVDALEQVLGRGVPRPSQVGRQPGERGEPLGQMSANGESAEGLHGSDLTEVPPPSLTPLRPRGVGLTTTV